MDTKLDSFIIEKFKNFLESLKSSSWTLPASEKTIDNLFNRALELEEIFIQEKANELIHKHYPKLNINKPVDFLIEYVIKSQHLDDNLTVYAINKYTSLYSIDDFSILLSRLLAEVELRGHLFNLIEETPDVDLDLYRLNNFLCGMISSSDLQSKVQNALSCDTSVLLKSIQHGEFLTAQTVMDEMIACLESQTDLRLWFLLMKEEHIETVLDLCTTYGTFLDAVLKFFDKFAVEMESIYDEDLNAQYSHVNLDFEDFVKIFQLFLNKEGINKVISEFLDSKNVTVQNFLFWVDVRSCL